MTQNRVDGIMENIRLQKDVHVILNEARKPKPATSEPAQEPVVEAPTEAPTESQVSEPAQSPDLTAGIAELLSLLQEYAVSLQSFYSEVKNGAEALKAQIIEAVKAEIQNAQIGDAPAPVSPVSKPRRR